MKVVKVKYYDGTIHCWYDCPGCKQPHAFSPSVHQWNGDKENPTISQSLLHNNPQNVDTCHSFIENGYIRFLDDCHHEMKGKTVLLPDFNVDQLDNDLVTIID